MDIISYCSRIYFIIQFTEYQFKFKNIYPSFISQKSITLWVCYILQLFEKLQCFPHSTNTILIQSIPVQHTDKRAC